MCFKPKKVVQKLNSIKDYEIIYYFLRGEIFIQIQKNRHNGETQRSRLDTLIPKKQQQIN